MLISFWVAIALQSVVAIEQDWQNTNALRTIDLTRSYVKESLAIILENISGRSQSRYFIPVEHNATYGSFEVREKGKSISTTPKLQVRKGLDAWEIILANPVPTGEKITLTVVSVRLNALAPMPTTMEQNGKQYLKYSTEKHIPTFYRNMKEKTKLKFPNSDVIELSGQAERQGNILSYGPYENRHADPHDTVVVRFEHTTPLPTITYFERDIEISHWGGNIAFEDRYAITNKAAALQAQFDRIAYSQSAFYNPESAAIRSLSFPLPAGTRDAYFTDEIGNVSTSKFRTSIRDANLEIKPRYPVFGNWNYTFTTGWNNDLGNFLRREGTRYYLKVPFIEGAENVVYEDLKVRLILPEGAENVEVHCSFDLSGETHRAHKTFMDTAGRYMVILEAQDLTDETVRGDMYVQYDLSTGAFYRKPLVMIGSVAAVLCLAGLMSRII